MFSPKKILCPTDFSDLSLKAVEAANKLAAIFHADLIVAHAIMPVTRLPYPGPNPNTDLSEVNRDLMDHARKSLDTIVREHISGEVLVQAFVLQGLASDEIIKLTEVEHVDLIVISTHGLSGWRRFIFGSVTEKVLKQAPCSVLTIQPSDKEAT